jgi:excisionase family DNA binding protein
MATHRRSWRPTARPRAHLPHGPARPRWLIHKRTRHAARGAHRPGGRRDPAGGRNQLYQAVARGELGSVHIGRSIRIPKQALLDLLAAASPPPAHGDD